MKQILQILPEAWKNVRSQKMRTWITAGIIALGIMALVGILTSVEAMKAAVKDSFSKLGANSINITRNPMVFFGNRNRKYNPKIEYREAVEFKNRMKDDAVVTMYFAPTNNEEIISRWDKTDPSIRVMGIDENFFLNYSGGIEFGREFTKEEVESGKKVVIIGADVNKKLFPTSDALGQNISIRGEKYRVIGIAEALGTMMGMSKDVIVFLPIKAARATYADFNLQYDILLVPKEGISVDDAIDKSTILFRQVRKLIPSQEDNFYVTSSSSALESMFSVLNQVRLAALVIGFITILGSAVALMNIMMVSVTQRTKEIGIMKALGATRSMIKIQFLSESIIIGQIGGFFGIILGILIGNVVAAAMSAPFIVPWAEIILAFIVTFATGVISGYFPAKKAAKLDPIESLRYE